MLTVFGIALRKLRIDHRETLKSMADKLHMSSSYLSAIEVGKRNIPDDLIGKISRVYMLDQNTVNELENASFDSQNEVTLALENALPNKREAALLFARTFDVLDEPTAERLREILEAYRKEDNT
jgi:transcriptional regulator with XRE-family HTH domain